MSGADVSAGAPEREALPLPARNSVRPRAGSARPGGAAMSGTSSPEAVKKLLENMQGDLRGLSLECRKKFPPVKEVRGGMSRGGPGAGRCCEGASLAAGPGRSGGGRQRPLSPVPLPLRSVLHGRGSPSALCAETGLCRSRLLVGRCF